MAAWFTVYSPRSLRYVTAADIFAALDAADLYTLAEAFGIEDEAVVERAASALRVEPATGKLGEWFEVRYRPARYRPLVVYSWTDPARVRVELTETEENYLEGRPGRGVAQVRAALKGVVEVAAVELGLGQLEDMGLVIAGQVAEYLAGGVGGLIRDTGDEWWIMPHGVPRRLAVGDQEA